MNTSPATIGRKLLFATLNPPVSQHGGGVNSVLLFLKSFLDAGFEVSFLYLDPTRHSADVHEAARRKLLDLGVSRVDYIEHRRDLFAPRQLRGLSGLIRKIADRLTYSDAYYNPWREMAGDVGAAVEAIGPDICFLYMIDTSAAFVEVDTVPKVLGIGVFPHKIRDVRIKLQRNRSISHWLYERLEFALQRSKYLRSTRMLLDSVSRICVFAANEGDTCRRLAPGVAVRYFPNPIPDERPARDDNRPIDVSTPPPYRVSLVGHLRGAATLSGLDYFARQIIPALARRNVLDQFRFEIIGKFDPPDWLKARLRSAPVVFTGFVDDFAAAIGSGHAFLVPTPDDVGNRSRIVSAWSVGCCVVCHSTSRLGMPELKVGENCLMGETGDEIAEALLAGCRDGDLNRRLRENGRVEYERTFRPDISLPPIIDFVADAGDTTARPDDAASF